MMYGVVLDLDDTLLAASNVYYMALLDTMRMVEQDLYPYFMYPGDMLDTFHEVEDRVWAGEFGHTEYFDKEIHESSLVRGSSFPRELGEFYAECMLRQGTVPQRPRVTKAYEFGERIFDVSNYRLVPGAKGLIHFVTNCDRIVPFILTHGDEKLQLPKVKKDVFNGFEKIIISPLSSDNGERVKKLAEEYDDIDEWIMVGDSIPRDINPALAEGYQACHIVRHSSHISEGDIIAIGDSLDRYHRFDNVSDFTKYLKGVVADARKAEVPLEERVGGIPGTP
jgi:hypothetical protein